jgi:hypothetical protein
VCGVSLQQWLSFCTIAKNAFGHVNTSNSTASFHQFHGQSPWEANSRSASQEMSSFLWNPKFHYSFLNSLSLVPILSHTNTVHILPSTPSGLLPSGFQTKILYVFLISLVRTTHYIHPILLDMIAQIISEEYKL